MGHVTLTTLILSVICHTYAGLDIDYRFSKFDHCSFSCSGDMIGVYQNLNGSRDLTIPLSGTVCHTKYLQELIRR